LNEATICKVVESVHNNNNKTMPSDEVMMSADGHARLAQVPYDLYVREDCKVVGT
jgi:hypothetical protein